MMDFTRKRSLFKRPGAEDEEDYYADAAREVQSKPIAQKFAKKLGPEHQPRKFMAATASSARDFYSNNQVMEIEEKQRKKEAELAEAASQLTPDEKNKLSAKILKAELLGNTDLVKKLKAQLESGKFTDPNRAPRSDDVEESSSSGDKEIILTKTDFRTGLTVPYKSKPKIDLRAETSSREASVKSLQELVEDEKMTSADDNLAMIGDMASRSTASQRIDSEWTIDDVMLAKKHKERDEEKRRSKVIADQKRFEQTLDSCPFCIDSKKLKKHLIIATGLKTYLAVPERQSLVEGHCLIVPMSHTSSSVQLDEDVFDEMKIWRKGLVALFREKEEDCVFLETAKNVEHQPHMVIECIPLPVEAGDTAPIYFKKAILECEKEWSNNKKLVELAGKDIRRVIPKGFSYFSVDFGLQSGFAHVIEDEKMISSYFGKEIIGGMLDLDHNLWRKPSKESFDEQKEKVKQMKAIWTPFDWTERAKRALEDSGDSD